MPATRPFCVLLLEHLRESDYATSSGRPNLAAFARELDGISYETLRRVATGKRQPSLRLMEEAARVLRLNPDVFAEHALLKARQAVSFMDVGLDSAWRSLLELADPLDDEIPPASPEAVRQVWESLAARESA